MNNELCEENLLIFAAKNYYSPLGIDADEFKEDFNRYRYVKRLINRYLDNDVLSERLILNHLIVIFNVFGIDPGLKIMGFKIEKKHWPVLKPFLIFLRVIQNDQYTNIVQEPNVVEALRKI